MIAEETGMKADSIDQTYNTIIAENIAASVKNGDCKFIPANATQVTGQVLNEIKVNGESEDCIFRSFSRADRRVTKGIG